jgi:hypothetical protein
MALLLRAAHRFLVFCDDLSFEAADTSYKSLKAVLEGGIEGRPENVVFYATSNRRHLMARDMMENERSTAINPGEAVEERRCRSRPFWALAAFTAAARTNIWIWSRAMSPITTSRCSPTCSGARRWNGPPRVAPARGGWRGSTCRIWRAGWGFRFERDRPKSFIDHDFARQQSPARNCLSVNIVL